MEEDNAITASIEPDEEPDRQAMPVDAEELPHLAFPVVGMGGSAGGLEAFTDFFKAMPSDSTPRSCGRARPR